MIDLSRFKRASSVLFLAVLSLFVASPCLAQSLSKTPETVEELTQVQQRELRDYKKRVLRARRMLNQVGLAPSTPQPPPTSVRPSTKTKKLPNQGERTPLASPAIKPSRVSNPNHTEDTVQETSRPRPHSSITGAINTTPAPLMETKPDLPKTVALPAPSEETPLPTVTTMEKEEEQELSTYSFTDDSNPTQASVIPVSIKEQRDPFATSGAMIIEAKRQGTGSVFVSGGSGQKVPKLTLRGYIEGTDGEEAAALLEIRGSGVFLVRKGDDISLYQGNKQNTVLKVKAVDKLTAKVEVGSLGQTIVVR